MAFDRLERGNFSAVKGVGAGVFEFRMDFGPGYRIYFGKDGEELVVLLGGRQQAAPTKRHSSRSTPMAALQTIEAKA